MKKQLEKHHSGTLGSASQSNAFDDANKPTERGAGTLEQHMPMLVQQSNNIDLGRLWKDERQTNARVNYCQIHFDRDLRVGTRRFTYMVERQRLSEMVSKTTGAGENIRPSKR